MDKKIILDAYRFFKAACNRQLEEWAIFGSIMDKNLAPADRVSAEKWESEYQNIIADNIFFGTAENELWLSFQSPEKLAEDEEIMNSLFA